MARFGEPQTARSKPPRPVGSGVNRSTATLVGLVALALAAGSFVVLGFSRLVVGHSVAVLLAAPLGLAAFGLAVALFVGFVLAALGVGPLAAGEDGPG